MTAEYLGQKAPRAALVKWRASRLPPKKAPAKPARPREPVFGAWTPHTDRKNAFWTLYAPKQFGDIWRMQVASRGRPLGQERWIWMVTLGQDEIRRGECKSAQFAKIACTQAWKQEQQK